MAVVTLCVTVSTVLKCRGYINRLETECSYFSCNFTFQWYNGWAKEARYYY